MRTRFGVTTLLFVPLTLLAQTRSAVPRTSGASTPQTERISSLALIESENCPVRLGAERWSTPQVRKAVAFALRPGEEPAAPVHGLYLSTSPFEPLQSIASATAVLRGIAPGPRVQPANGAEAETRSQTFDLASEQRDVNGRWKLTADHVPLVREIDLVEIHFRSGATWHESSTSHCRVQPSGLLYVANR